ncbi:hypothetical protein ACF090_11100 [Streptomyces sp. NPDC014892]|uniref:hypothetical protein n=1 Tax=Streptomyces sp. NPDC014892 TaxID=3364930 RepID=UPI0036F4D041
MGDRSDHIFRWPTLTLRPGRNTVTVTATINGTTYTDSADWHSPETCHLSPPAYPRNDRRTWQWVLSLLVSAALRSARHVW